MYGRRNSYNNAGTMLGRANMALVRFPEVDHVWRPNGNAKESKMKHADVTAVKRQRGQDASQID